MKNVYGLIMAMMLSHSVMAADILISTATSDVDSVVTKLWVTTDEFGEATGLKMTFNDGTPDKSFTPAQVRSGMVLKKVDSYDVVVIKSRDFEVDRGGHLTMEYLSNGITGSRNDKELEIEFNGAGWELFHDGRDVDKFHFKGRKILGKLVGIKDVQIK